METLPKDLLNLLCNTYLDVLDCTRFAQTSKKYYDIVTPIIKQNTYSFTILCKSIEAPDFCNQDGNIYQNQQPIGNFIWMTTIKTTEPILRVCDHEWYEKYDFSDRYFMENYEQFNGIKGQTITVHARNTAKSVHVSIHYKTEFGQFLQIVWWDKYIGRHCHLKLVWTPGDVWIGQIVIDKYMSSNIEYRYEVCVDHGGPVIKKEIIYRALKAPEGNYGDFVIIDIWNLKFL